MLLPFVVSLLLSSYCAPFILLGAFHYGYTQFNYSSLELIVAFSVFVNAIFAGDGFNPVSCSGEYFECAILLDRLYLGVSSMHLDILFPDTVFYGSTMYLGFSLGSTFTLLLQGSFLIKTPRSNSVEGLVLTYLSGNMLQPVPHLLYNIIRSDMLP